MKKVVLMSVFSLVFITGCDIYGGGLIVEPGYSPRYSSPPSHAPAHGRRAYRYQYYPNAEFYFDTGRNMYYFLDSSLRWTFSVNLPLRLRHHLYNNYVEIEMDDDRPYRRHKYYKNKYKKHKSKYRRNNDNRKHKYNSGGLNDGTQYKRKHKKKVKKYNQKHRGDDDGYDKKRRSKKSKKDRNKH
jgi:hypothetical protein